MSTGKNPKETKENKDAAFEALMEQRIRDNFTTPATRMCRFPTNG